MSIFNAQTVGVTANMLNSTLEFDVIDVQEMIVKVDALSQGDTSVTLDYNILSNMLEHYINLI